MKKFVWMRVVTAVVGMGFCTIAAQRTKAESEEPTPLTPLNGALLLVNTNAQGRVVGATIQTSSLHCNLLTNGMDAAALKELAKMNDKPVDLKGEISQVGKDLCVKAVGSIKNMTPSLLGSVLTAATNAQGQVQLAVRTADSRYTYSVVTTGMSEDVLKGLLKWNGKTVDLEGDIPQSKMCVTPTSAIREAKAPKKVETRPATPNKKKGK